MTPRAVVIAGIHAASKAFLSWGCRTTIHNHQAFLRAVLERDASRPLITLTNHHSVIDDPFLFGCLPLHISLDSNVAVLGTRASGRMRWSLGAQEICFSNRATSWFFDAGKVVPIKRGAGVYQSGMDRAVNLLAAGEWVHIFPEGKVVQDSNRLHPFKWGVGRLILDSPVPPIILPLYHNGLQHVMPEGRCLKLPIPGHRVDIAFGEPIEFDPSLAHTIQNRKAITETLWQAVDKLRLEVRSY